VSFAFPLAKPPEEAPIVMPSRAQPNANCPGTARRRCRSRTSSVRIDGLVVIADLSQHVLFFRLDDGFLPPRPGKRLERLY
jgi:hypothetical protein